MTDNAARPMSVLRGQHRPLILALLGMMTCVAFESFAITTALPVIAHDLDAERWYSLAYASTLTAALIGMTIGGNWADRRGVVMPLAVGGFAFLVGIALCVVAPTMEVFVTGRLLQGIGGGIDSVVMYVVIAQFVPAGLHPRVFGLLTAAWLLPGIAGPLVTGVVVEFVGWRSVFALVLIGSAASLTSLLIMVRGSIRLRTDTAVFGSRGVWAVVAAAGVLALHQASQQEIGVLVPGTVCAVVLIGISATRLLPQGTFRIRPGIPRLTALRGLLGATVAATDIYLPLYLQRQLDYSPSRSGLIVALGALGWIAGAWLQGRTSGRSNGLVIVPKAAVFVLIGPVSALLFIAGAIPVAALVAGCVVMGAGMGMAYPRITATVLAESTEEEQGTNSSALQISESMSQSILIAVTGAVLSLTILHEFTIAYSLVAGIGGVAVLVACQSVRR
ncbi:MFS transporter [Rhodococcus sp. 06-235-1A]|uniref:MFS transporter n=1 Tax=Rhodococcus sp. 06-235-1A TaxID=2022508 RepID=UPI001C52AA48|nr:MFS transporter [Rhodococcus sp. 06-235-1A]